MGDFEDIFDAVENTSTTKIDSKPKKEKQSKWRKKKEPKQEPIVEETNGLDSLFLNHSEEPKHSNNVEPSNEVKTKEKKSIFKWSKANQIEEHSNEDVTNKSWTLMSEDVLTEHEAPQEVEDVVDTHERVIGRKLKTELDINEARTLDLSIRDRIELTRKYMTKESEELRRLEEYRKEEEKRVNHVVTLKNFLLTELAVNLQNTNEELVVCIDAKFGPYIEEALKEVELGHYVKEIPRNADLVNLNPNLPYRYSFMIKAI